MVTGSLSGGIEILSHEGYRFADTEVSWEIQSQKDITDPDAPADSFIPLPIPMSLSCFSYFIVFCHYNFSEVTHFATSAMQPVSALNAMVAHHMRHLKVTPSTDMITLAQPGVPSFSLLE